MRTTVLLALTLLMFYQGSAQTNAVYAGVVVDSATGVGIAGASIRVEGTGKGTYTKSGGTFRLPLPPATYILRVRSIGYGERTVRIEAPTSDLRILLPVRAVEKGAVTVQADITPEEIMRRAIARKNQNAARIKTLERSMYSKMRVDFTNKSIFKDPNSDVQAITETFSRVYEQRQPKPARKHSVIVQRRQTRNVPASENLAIFDELFDFTEDEINLLNVRLVTPLGVDALKEYQFHIVSKKSIGNLVSYEMAFEPKSRLFPGFEGTIVIVDGTYQVIEARFAPTQETAFPFLKNLRFEQKFELVGDSVWVSMYQYIAAEVRVKIIAGLADFTLNAQAQSWVQEAKLNMDIPDSLLSKKVEGVGKTTIAVGASSDGSTTASASTERDNITVLPDADTARSEFWEQNTVAELNDEERKIYLKQDSIMSDTTRVRRKQSDVADRTVGMISIAKFGDVAIGVSPLFNNTSITGVLYGGNVDVVGGPISVRGMLAFGSNSTRVGSVGLNASVIDRPTTKVDVTAEVYSNVASIQRGRSVLDKFSNLHFENLLYASYVDFYRRDGFDVGASATFGKFRIAAVGASARHFAMPLITEQSREEVLPVNGDYRTVHATLTVGEPNFIEKMLGNAWPVAGSVTAGYGQEQHSRQAFRSISAVMNGRISTFDVGYYPMHLDVTLEGGIGSVETPRQYQFSSLRRYPFFGGSTDLATVPINYLGGTEFVTVHGEHNFSDLLWRAIGIPTYNGRGIDMIAAASAASYVQRGTPLATAFRSSQGWYAEAGFALARIPTFISDLFFLRFDARWPIGPIAVPVGSFGWSITISSPLL